MASEKPKFDELARQSLEQHKDRRSMEWRVNIAFWTPIVLFTWYLLRGDATLIDENGRFLFYCYSFLLGCLWGIYTWLHQTSKQRANRIDTDWKHWWIQHEVKADTDAAERRRGDKLRPPATTGSFSKEEWDKAVTNSMWFWSQTLFTTVIMAFSWLVFFFRLDKVPDIYLSILLLIIPAMYFWWRWWYYEYADAPSKGDEELKVAENNEKDDSDSRFKKLNDFLSWPQGKYFWDYLVKMLKTSFLPFWPQLVVSIVLVVGLLVLVANDWDWLRMILVWLRANWVSLASFVLFLFVLLVWPRKAGNTGDADDS